MPDVPAGWVTALERLLEDADPDGTIARYVLTGEPGTALAYVSDDPAAEGLRDVLNGGALDWHLRGTAEDEKSADFYAGTGEAGAAVLSRWGRVLDAAGPPRRPGFVLGAVAGRHWPETMLARAGDGAVTGPLPVTFADLARIAAEDNAAPADLVRMLFTVTPGMSFWNSQYYRNYLRRLPGLAGAVAACPGPVPAFTSGSVDARRAVLSCLGELGDDVLAALAGPLAEVATGTSSRARAEARPLLARAGGAAAAPLRALATGARPAQRARALGLLAELPGQRDWARETAAADRSPSVRAVAGRCDELAAYENAERSRPDLSPLPSGTLPSADAGRVAGEVLEIIRAAYEADSSSQSWPAIPRDAHGRLAALLAADGPIAAGDRLATIPRDADRGRAPGPVVREIQRRGYALATLFRILNALDLLRECRPGQWSWTEIARELHARPGGPDLLAVQRTLDAAGADGRRLTWSAFTFQNGDRALGRDWPDGQVRPFLKVNAGWIIARKLVECPDGFGGDDKVFQIAEVLPVLPERLAARLYAQATGAFREKPPAPAQAVLERDPRRAARAAEGLRDGKASARRVTSEWLARIADPAALPALREAWRREKHDAVRGALLDALAAAGDDPGTYLTREVAVADARRPEISERAGDLSWLDWESLPGLAWAADGAPVPLAVAECFCVIAARGDSASPAAILRHYARLFDRASRERLAERLLVRWLEHGSGTYYRGLLAAVAVLGGASVVPPTERALAEPMSDMHLVRRGRRLVEMLAGVDHPGARRLLVSVAAEFRAQTVRRVARDQVRKAADREGLTPGEFADRFIPEGSFAGGGALTLPYGPRAFTAVLGPDLSIGLRGPDGTAVKSLPAPRRSDDADRVRESKAALAAARKEVRSIARVQRRRLREAMADGRSWTAADWERLLLGHPVVGPLTRRLVWTSRTADGTTVTFRPLDDGTLTDAGDNDVRLPAGARIMIAAADSGLPSSTVAEWGEHLADYEIVPLFGQFETEDA